MKEFGLVDLWLITAALVVVVVIKALASCGVL